ncbi:MAG: phosphonoacetaldehyde reductase [Chloroflexota bacterium]
MGEADSWGTTNPVRVIFGPGSLDRLRSVTVGRSLLVTTRGMTRRGVTQRVQQLLGADRTLVYDRVDANPAVEAVKAAITALRDKLPVESVVGLGGGSVIDSAKVLSLALAEPTFDLEAWLSDGQRYDSTEPLPLVAVPTTAGTGSEVTPFATLWDTVARRKLSVTTPKLHPSVALVDPQLALSLPWEATLGPGLDAYTQCFEAIWNRNSTPETTALARRGLALVPAAMRTLHSELDSIRARTEMAEAALLSGLAISQTRTALAHSMSYPITAHLGLPHGLACALVLPAVLAFTLEADDVRLDEVTGGRQVDLVRQVRELFVELGLPSAVKRHIPSPGRLQSLAPEMLTPGRADNNLRAASVEDVRAMLAATEAWVWDGGGGR